MSRTETFWLNKIKLWFALRGGIDNWFETHYHSELCKKCPFYRESDQQIPYRGSQVRPLTVYNNSRPYNWVMKECKKKVEFRGRLMVSEDLKEIEFKQGEDGGFFCAEWVKNV